MAEQVEQLRSPVIGKGRRGHLQRGGARGLGEELDTLPTVTRRIQHVEGRWKGKGTPEGLLLFSHQSCLLLPPPSIFLSFYKRVLSSYCMPWHCSSAAVIAANKTDKTPPLMVHTFSPAQSQPVK